MKLLNLNSEKFTYACFVSAVVCCVLVLSYLREPLFFLQPRIWAEEGTVHIQAALNNGILSSLIQPHLGYYSFFNNYVVGLGIAIFGLEKIAYVTTIFSAVVILATLFAPLVLTSSYWRSNTKKGLIIFFALLVGSGEIWVNTVNTQFYFGLFTCFLLFSETVKLSGWRYVYVFVMLIQAALTGVTSVIFLPFFLWKYFIQEKKSDVDLKIVAVLSLGLIVQLGSLFYLKMDGELGRFSLTNLPNFPFGTLSNLTAFIPNTADNTKILLLVVLLFTGFYQRMKISLISPIIVAVYASTVFAFLALEMRGAERYGYIPSVLVFVFLLSLLPSKHKLLDLMLISIIGAVLLLSLSKFFKTDHFYNHAWVPYDVERAYRQGSGMLYIKIFPQWEHTNLVIELPEKEYERHQ